MEYTEVLRIPEISCPFSPRVNPHVDAVHAHLLQWVRDFDLIQSGTALRRFSQSRFASLAARCHPNATREELILISEWHVWTFLLDDLFDESEKGRQPEYMQPALRYFLSVVNDPAVRAQGPLAEALSNFWRRIILLTTPQWQKRFIGDLSEYFHACLVETRWRVQGGPPPDLETYIENRDKAGCVMPALDILEIQRHINLPCSLPGSPTIETLRRAVCRFVCWVNDIYSLRKELAEDGRMNTILVIKQVYQCTLQEAIDQLRAMIDEQIHFFQETELAVISQSPEMYQNIRHYLIELRGALRGYLDWLRETNHYCVEIEKNDSFQIERSENLLSSV
jgi:Terpene synthase family 2, C-terminal metal binding